MSANVPAEAVPALRRCPTCGKELAPEAEECSCAAQPAAAPTPAAGMKLCPICTKELPIPAKKCLSCGEYVNWEGRLTSVKGLLAVAVTVSTLVTGVLGIWTVWPRPSRTRVLKVDPSADSTELVIHVQNSGKKDSRVHRDFTVRLADEGILRFGSLMLLSPETWVVVPSGKTKRLEFSIADIELISAVDRDKFADRHGDRKVILKGKVIESNGQERELLHEVSVRELLPFFKHRVTWPPRPKGS